MNTHDEYEDYIFTIRLSVTRYHCIMITLSIFNGFASPFVILSFSGGEIWRPRAHSAQGSQELTTGVVSVVYINFSSLYPHVIYSHFLFIL